MVLLSLLACRETPPPPEPVAVEPTPLAAQRPLTSSLSPTVPTDLPNNPTQADAVTFAWQSFVAVNWPALTGARGVPDPNQTIGQPGPTVWETWKRPDEVFLPDGSTPVPWDQYGGSTPPECGGAGQGDFVMTRMSKSPDGGSPVFERLEEAVGGTVTDQHGLVARFELAMNRPMFDYITSNTLYNLQGQAAFFGDVDFTDGVMEVKAAWRQFTDADSPTIRSRYHQRVAWIYTPPMGGQPATCVQSAVGLVGLHVTQKTPSRPEWIWATFEQIDNVPPFGTETAGPVPYSFNNPACDPATCPPNQSTEKDGVPTSTPTQVTRQIDIGLAAQAANPGWQQQLGAVSGSPWPYYQLVDVQWPRTPGQPMGNPTPLLNANVVMETYVPESSCMGCHYAAQIADGSKPSDYSYLLAEAQGPAATGGAK